MSSHSTELYYSRLAHLKRALSDEMYKRKKNKKKFTPNQLIMINFINNVTKKAIFHIKDKKIILRKGWGDGKGIKGTGFQHILEKHYCKGCPGEITLNDILNMDLVISRGILLNDEGVTNTDNIVYRYIKGPQQYNVILKYENENELVVSFYSID